MYNDLVKKLYPRYKKHLTEKTLNIFWSELSRRDFLTDSIKEKTKKIQSIKNQLKFYHQKKLKIQQNNYDSKSLEKLMDQLNINESINDLLKKNSKNFIYYEDNDDSFYYDEFINLKTKLIMYNNCLEDELNYIQHMGKLKSLCPYNALQNYISLLQSKDNHFEFLRNITNTLIAGYADKIFINQVHVMYEPDIIARKFNKYGFYESVLFKICPIQVFDSTLITKWSSKYGPFSKIIIIDLQILNQKISDLFEVWNRFDLIEICVNGELALNNNYLSYTFDSPEYFEIIKQI